MRKNLPVTDVEHKLAPNEYIVSKTDLMGRILYVNRPFLEISGFDEEELIGEHHNVVRHPDMPREAFFDLWHTLKRGRPWRGMVKNRCKNGDYYWVDASANPIWKDGEAVGYMSLRAAPTRNQIRAADAAYKAFREGRARGKTVAEGQVVASGLLGRLQALVPTRIRAWLILMALATAGLVCGLVQQAIAAGASTTLAGATGALALIILALLVTVINQRLLQPLRQALTACQMIASGNLAVALRSSRRDEVGELFHAIRTMAANLDSIVTDVRRAAQELSSSSEEVSATADQLSDSANAQAASVEQTSAAMEQMSESIQQNAESAGNTDQISRQAAQEAGSGGQSVARTVEAMHEIAQKIGVIDEIAYQTNLLALNAAIEAGRAGEQGRGFAVVAAEVGKLAERCQQAAAEIGDVARSSVGLAEQAGKVLNDMVPTINKASVLVQDIAAACIEQADGAAQVNGAMGQIALAAQRSAEASGTLAGTAQSMTEQATKLQQLMSFFSR